MVQVYRTEYPLKCLSQRDSGSASRIVEFDLLQSWD